MILCTMPECQTSAGCMCRRSGIMSDGLIYAQASRKNVPDEAINASLEKARQELLIETLRSRAEKAEAEHQQSSRDWRDAFDAMHQRAMKAEATCEKLAAALDAYDRVNFNDAAKDAYNEALANDTISEVSQ